MFATTKGTIPALGALPVSSQAPSRTAATLSPMKTASLKYVMVTPARNEADYIELTIQSMIKQTVLPLRWVIVSDGSTDRTDEIAASYAAKYEWIEFLKMPP